MEICIKQHIIHITIKEHISITSFGVDGNSAEMAQ